MLRPTAYLTCALNEEQATAEIAAALKRAFSYLAPTTVAKAKSESEGAQLNTLALEVRLPQHPFMRADNEEADQVWQEVIRPWLSTKLDTLFGTVREFNNETRRSFVTKIDFAAFVLVLDSVVFHFELEPDSTLRPWEGVVESVRSWLTSPQAQNVNVARVNIPSNKERGEQDWFDIHTKEGDVQRIPLK